MMAPKIAKVMNSTLNCKDPVFRDRISRTDARL
jgi:hypothetical protein